jgi:hypothetical protein
VLAVVREADLAADPRDVPAKLVVLLRADRMFDLEVLDQLMNQWMVSDKIAMGWRGGPGGGVRPRRYPPGGR